VQVRVVGVHLVEVEARPFLALVQEAAPGGDLGWQIEDCDFHMGKRGEASLVRPLSSREHTSDSSPSRRAGSGWCTVWHVSLLSCCLACAPFWIAIGSHQMQLCGSKCA